MSDNRPVPALRYLSLGWGVQSFCIAAMAALREHEAPDVLIHADTTHESQGTYEFARRWTPWLREHGLDVVTTTAPATGVTADQGRDSVAIPAFTLRKTNGDHGQIKRQCTSHWKIAPLRRRVRELLGRPTYTGAVECWQGISLDEWHRMRSSDVKYITNRYPLVDLRMSRQDCIIWLEAHGLEVPPKSSCTFCPFHALSHWREMKRRGGNDWDTAVAADTEVRNARTQFQLYVHPARLPLEQAVAIPEDEGAFQTEFEFDRPCDGGVCFT